MNSRQRRKDRRIRLIVWVRMQDADDRLFKAEKAAKVAQHATIAAKPPEKTRWKAT